MGWLCRLGSAAMVLSGLLPGLSAQADSVVVINEIHYQPESASQEFVELYNPLSVDVDMSGWRFDGGITFDFPEGTILPARSHRVVARDPVALEAATGHAGALGPFNGALANQGETLRLWNNNSASRSRQLPSPPPAAAELWSVDIQGDGVGGVFGQVPPTLMSGPEAMSGVGAVWNAFTVPGHPAVISNPTLSLKDSAGANSAVSFAVTGTVSGFSVSSSGGSTPIFADYLFIKAGNADSSITWKISGLDSAKSYSLWLYGSSARSIRMRVDIDGDSSLVNNSLVTVPADGGIQISGIKPGADGVINGEADTASGEGNWGGFQLMVPPGSEPGELVTAVPNQSLENRRLMEELTYGIDGEWPAGPAGSGFTLAKIDPRGGSQASNWAVSAQINGSPGKRNFAESAPGSAPAEGLLPVAGPPVFLNEISGSADSGFLIELYHAGKGTVSLEGWTLVDRDSQSTFPFHAGATLAVGEFMVLDEDALGFRPAEGSVIFLHAPTRLADAVGVTAGLRGRQQAGTGRWLHPSSATFGAPNEFEIAENVVINEIFHSAMGRADEEWLELKNAGEEVADISGWKLAGGVDFIFPQGTGIAAGGYLVVAKDSLALREKYPDRPIIGDFSRRLGSEDHVVLIDVNGNPADEISYASDGAWPGRADKGGSSMELRDPRADNSRPEAWAASATGPLGEWQTISYSAVATDDGIGNDAFHDFLLGMLEEGEVLIDDVSVRENPAGANVELIQNGGFEADVIGSVPQAWRCLGNHGQDRSVVVADPDDPTNRCFRIFATGNTEDKHNRVETTFAAGRQVVLGRTYQISLRARWMGGSQQVNTRLYFNHLQKTTLLAAGDRWGTPGLPNSSRLANLGPTFEGFNHHPAVPAAGGLVTVSATLRDPQGVAAAMLFYRIGSGTWQSVSMNTIESGAHAAAVPGQSSGTLVQYFIRATDGLGAVAEYPAGGAAGGAFFRVANNDADTSGLRGNLRVLISPENQTLLFSATNRMSNDTFPATVIEDEIHIYHDCALRLKGSAFGRFAGTEFGYNIKFSAQSPYRGVHTSVSIERAGDMKEIVAKHILNRAGGGHWSQYDDVARINGPGVSGIALIAASRTTGVFLNGLFPELPRGTVFNHELLYQPNGTLDGSPQSIKLNNPYNHNRGTYDLMDRGEDKEAYRWGWQIRSKRLDDDYSSIVRLNRAFALTGADFAREIVEIIDVDQWMRTWAIMGLYGNDDQYGRVWAHNWRLYQRPTDGRLIALPWDLDRAFNLSTSSPLLPTGFAITKLFTVPAFKRLFDSHVLDIVNTTFNSSYMTGWVAHFGLVTAEGGKFGGIPGYVGTRSGHALGTLPAPVPFAITTNGGADFTTSENLVTLEGTGWSDIASVSLSNHDVPLNLIWTGPTAWRTELSLVNGVNSINLIARDPQGLEIGVAGLSITSESTTVPASSENLVVSELHYHPHPPTPAEIAAGFGHDREFEYIELQNIDETRSIDLSRVRFDRGVSYVVSPGTLVPPGGKVVIPRRAAAFALRHPGVPILPQYFITTDPTGNQLSNGGEEIRLVGADEQPIKWFVYEDTAPWPVAADGDGPTLVLISPRTNPDHSDPLSWRASLSTGGAPGGSDGKPFTGDAVADANGDGVPDLVGHAIGAGLPSFMTTDGSGGFWFTLERDVAAEVELNVERSTTLLPGSWQVIGSGSLISRSTAGGSLERLVFSIAAPEAGLPVFVRIRARN